MEHALLVLESVIGKSMHWTFDLWMAGLDLRKAFNKIEYYSLFVAWSAQGVPPEYVNLLANSSKIKQVQWKEARLSLYNAMWNKVMVLSPALFNAGLEEAISCWKRRLTTHGFDVGTQDAFTKCTVCR